MTDAGFIDNKIIDIPSGVSFKDFDNIASIFNHYLKGKRLSDISMASIRKIVVKLLIPQFSMLSLIL
mgnify:CR=1 FL=1